MYSTSSPWSLTRTTNKPTGCGCPARFRLLQGAATGLGIPAGGGVIVHPDNTFEPLRRPAHEFRFDGTQVTRSQLRVADETDP